MKKETGNKMSRLPYEYKTLNGKKQPIHRHVMEEHMGRLLEPEEHVYHINGDSRDNRLENLIIIKKKSWNVLKKDELK